MNDEDDYDDDACDEDYGWRDELEVDRIIRASYDQTEQNRARVLGNIYLNHPGGDTVRLTFRTIMQAEFIGTEDGQDLLRGILRMLPLYEDAA